MVGARRKLAQRRAPEAQGLPEVGRFDAEVARHAGGDADVLRHQGELEAGSECPGQHLARNLALGGVVVPGGGVDRLEHGLRVEPERLRQQQRFEAGEGAGGAEVVVERLHRVAGAHRANMKDLVAELLEEGTRLRQRRLVAARHDGERRIARSGNRAGNRRIDQGNVFL